LKHRLRSLVVYGCSRRLLDQRQKQRWVWSSGLITWLVSEVFKAELSRWFYLDSGVPRVLIRKPWKAWISRHDSEKPWKNWAKISIYVAYPTPALPLLLPLHTRCGALANRPGRNTLPEKKGDGHLANGRAPYMSTSTINPLFYSLGLVSAPASSKQKYLPSAHRHRIGLGYLSISIPLLGVRRAGHGGLLVNTRLA
jgi:hypothetical protein